MEYLATTFALADDDVRGTFTEFLTDDADGIFRGPYLRVRTPFRQVDASWHAPLRWLPQAFLPYVHQAAAFQRLSSDGGRTTLDQTLDSGDGVRIGTMHRMKGLEFRCVAIADVDDDTVPSQHALTDRHADEVQFRTDLQRELCLLYVACTRAREQLWIGWSGKPSRFLEPVLAP